MYIYIHTSHDGPFIIHPQRILSLQGTYPLDALAKKTGNLSQNVSTSQGVNKSQAHGEMYPNKPN